MNNYKRFGMVPSLGMLASIVASKLAEDNTGIRATNPCGNEACFCSGDCLKPINDDIEGWGGIIGEDNSI